MKEQSSTIPAYDYATFPRRFVSYRWFKPILVALLTGAFMLVFQIILLLVATIASGNVNFVDSIGVGYDDMNAFTGPGALVELGGIAVLLPALALAALIVRDRPYSSYSSSRGGWNWGAFLKCMGAAAVLIAAIAIVQMLFFPEEGAAGDVRFTVLGFAVCMVLVPFQCVAEEYVFRGLILQAVGAWTKLPAVAIAVSAIAFAAGHPYNDIGIIAILANGIIWGALAWKTRGLEATSALHIVNNMLAFCTAGFGLSDMTSEVTVESLVVDVVMCAAYAAIVLVADRKWGWFTPKGDGTAAFNEKRRAKAALKRHRTARQAAPDQPFMPAVPPQGQPYASQAYPAFPQSAGAPYAQPAYPAASAAPQQPTPYAQRPYSPQQPPEAAHVRDAARLDAREPL